MGAPNKSSRSTKPWWEPKWSDFKTQMPHQKAPYSKRSWGGPYHSMCSYQGKMKPALAHHLIATFSKPGDVVVDPFSGAGTIPFEACRMGRFGKGMDISRLGYVLTLGKVGLPERQAVDKVVHELELSIKGDMPETADWEAAAQIDFNSAVPDYFHDETLREVLVARRFFLDRWSDCPAWAFAYSCVLHLLHGNRPYALSRRSHPITPYKPTGPKEYRPLIPRLEGKVARIFGQNIGAIPNGESHFADSTVQWPDGVGFADAVITSPPFFDSTRFYMTNWMRFWFTGWERGDFESQPTSFIETRQKTGLEVYGEVFAAAKASLKPSGVVVFHLGKSSKCNMGEELMSWAEPHFSVADCYTEDVEHCESHGIRDKGTVVGHTYLVLIPR